MLLRYLIKVFYCNFSMQNTLHHTSMNNRLPEDEPSGSKHVADITNQNIGLEKLHFVGLYCIITSKESVDRKRQHSSSS
jgi:hypothetical protein